MNIPMKPDKTILLYPAALFFFLTTPVFALQQGWQANPEIVSDREEQRSEYLWRESDVPDYDLPDLSEILEENGVKSADEWSSLRFQILEMFRSEMYGRSPGQPEQLNFTVTEEDPKAMDGQATLRRVVIHSEHQGRSHRFELTLFLPNETDGAVPVFLLMNNRDPDNTDPNRDVVSGFWPAEEVIERGFGITAIQNGELAPDDAETYHEGVIRLFEGDQASETRPDDAWGALAAWGWGASRVMDYFEIAPGLDSGKVAVLGHSRGGKAALWAGAEDERFTIVISNDSGSGGAALSRRRFGETVRAVNRFTYWFTENFMKYSDREDQLPFDQHMLVALMAPRAVYIASADEDLWADPRGEFISLSQASPVYALWGHPTIDEDEVPPLNTPLVRGFRGYHVRSGGHNLTPTDWHFYMDFADRYWGGR